MPRFEFTRRAWFCRSWTPVLAAVTLVVLADETQRLSAAEPPLPKIAAIVTVYYHNSHADVIASRLVEGYTLDGRPPFPKLQLASLYVDQFPAGDKSRKLAEKYKFRLSPSIADALTLGTGRLAVDGVLLIAEHGEYPESPTGSIVYPKRAMFTEIAKACASSERSVPVFCDKHLADNWTDAKWIYDTARAQKIPLMAGSSLPGLWRYPAVDVPRDAKLREIVAVSYHRLDVYGFHALEAVQSLAERRAGGETGIKAVRCVEGRGVWEARDRGEFDRRLLDAALARLKEHPLPKDKRLEDLCELPQWFQIEYRDGLKVSILTLNGAVAEWSAAWNYQNDERIDSTLFWTQEARPFQHFAFLLQGVEAMVHSGKPSWPVERTLLTSGALDALLVSRREQGRRVETPQLEFAYRSDWNWQPPPPPPPDRPIPAQ